MSRGTAWLLGGVLALTACSEATARSSSGEEVPTNRNRTAALDAGFLDRAEVALAEATEPQEPDLRQGVILSENEDGYGSDWLVLTSTEQVLLSVASNCDGDGDSTYEMDLWQLLDPGDLITWSTRGDDDRVCTGEIDVRRKNAAGRAEEDER